MFCLFSVSFEIFNLVLFFHLDIFRDSNRIPSGRSSEMKIYYIIVIVVQLSVAFQVKGFSNRF